MKARKGLPFALALAWTFTAVACQRAERIETGGLAPVTDLEIEDPGVGNSLKLSWTNSASGSVTAVHIVRFVGVCISDPASQEGVHFETGTTGAGQYQEWVDEPDPERPEIPAISDGDEICYAVYAKHKDEYSSPETVTGSSTDRTSPGPIGDFLATPSDLPGDAAIDLTWTNPSDPDLDPLVILRRTDQYPEDLDDASAVVVPVQAKTSTSARDDQVEDGQVYYYRAWARDEVPNHSEPVDAVPVQRMVDDDEDGQDESEGDCNDADDLFWSGAPSSDCSATDWNCNGTGWEDDFCTDNIPAGLQIQCLEEPLTCDEGLGCRWVELENGTACDDGDPDTDAEICIAGVCLDNSLIEIPAGTFWMGCNEEVELCVGGWKEFELPYHEVFLDTYGIDRTEVTQVEYNACVLEGPCPVLMDLCFDPAVDPKLPVTCLNWSEAYLYCMWAGKRLCTEAEWEKAARGADGRIYPWGNDSPTCDLAVFNEPNGGEEDWGCGLGGEWEVGSKPLGASPYGALDMAGNVWEWVADWHDGNYYEYSPDSNPPGPEEGTDKVGRGGGIIDPAQYIRSPLRGLLEPEARGLDVGVRCCKTLPN